MKNFFLAIPIACSIISCSKTDSNIDLGNRIPVSIQISTGIETKATGVLDNATDERKINSLQIFVFDDEGKLDAYSKGTESTMTVNCSSGHKTIYAVVNHAELPDVASLSDLKAVTCPLAGHSKTNIEMIGSNDLTVSATDKSATVNVTRMSSRVVINKITKAFPSSIASMPFYIKGIYLCNAAGTASFDGTANPTIWYNKLERVPGEVEAALYSGSLSENVSGNSSYSVSHYFYAMPNPTVDDVTSDITASWSPRHTRLVVEVTIDGSTYYYPVTIPVMERGKSYEISELTLTRYGSSKPDVPVSVLSCTYSVSVEDWDPVSVTEGTTI